MTEKNEETKNNFEKPEVLFEWTAKEEKLSGKNLIFAAAVALAVIACLIFWLKNYFGSATIFLLYIIFYLYYGRENKELKFILRNDGIETESKFFFYDSLKSFRIIYLAGSTKELKITSKKKLIPEIAFPIGDADPVKIREIILKFIPEKD